ncbi:MAG: ABC-F family ATP-binding cassette domain-containing protein [Leptospirales bacterium]|nr:ABC-F family ATP-binding cassette domain-containing protein [Leptospirales bacterium]
MNIVSADKISKHIGDRSLFNEISFGVDSNDKLGLIGTNGSGKTTLLRIIAGLDETDQGKITKTNQLRIAYLPQIPVFEPNLSIRSAMLEPVSPVNSITGDDLERQMTNILAEIDVTNLDQTIGNLSGGMLKKIALAQTLALEPDLLILDEPTNHLDAWTNLWLEERLAAWKKAIFLITHDRYFLENVTGRILELDQGQLFQYDGNYSYYLEKKAEREMAAARVEAKASRLLKSELEWLRRQPKARGTKQKARVDRIEDLQTLSKGASNRSFEFDSSAVESKNRILEVKNLSAAFEDRVLFSGFEHIFKSRERLGVLGPNGCGKSTFFNLLMGVLTPATGEIKKGLHTRFGYFDQTSRDLDGTKKVIDYVKRNAGEILARGDGVVMEAARLLEYFGFSGRMQQGLISQLSGGERRRLHLVLVLMASPNFLILDEPTNDLDIATLVLLEDFLADFQGCVLVASHDRYFLDRVVSSLLVYEDGEIRRSNQSASEYIAINRDRGHEIVPAKAARTQAKAQEKRRLAAEEIKEYRALEREIETMEKKKSELETQLSNPAADYAKLTALGVEYEALNKVLVEKWARWEELGERKDG